MKYIFGIFLALVIAGGAYAENAKVVEIVDGDTFFATVSEKPVRVTLINVDAPELKGKCESEILVANKAEERLKELLPVDSVVELKNIKERKTAKGKKNSIGIRANVVLPDGRDVGEILIKENLGLANDKRYKKGWCASKIVKN